MRLLVVTQYFWPENFRINDLVSGLVERGHEVTVLTGKPNYPSGKVFSEYRNEPSRFSKYEGADIVRVPMISRGRSGIRLALNYMSFLVNGSIFGSMALRGKSFDAIFVFEPSPVTVGIPAIVIGKFKKAPIIFWVLDLWPDTLSAVGAVRSKILLGILGKLVSFIYNRCAYILGQSRSFVKSIKKYCSDADKVIYFPNWAEDIFTKKNTQEAAPELDQDDDKFTVLFAGNIGEAQDIPTILDAADILRGNRGIRWVFVGDGRKYEWLKEQVAARCLQDNVILLGRFPVERMPEFYAHADALLVSLKKDPVFCSTIPGKVQSYLMSGVPLIGVLDGEGSEVIKEAHAGFTCSAGDSICLAEAVRRMSEFPKDVLREYGDNGHRFANNEFNRSSLMSKLETLLERSAGKV